MAKLTDLPAELVHRIIRHILRPNANLQTYEWDCVLVDPDDHHLLDHNEIGAVQRKLRPHHELEHRAHTLPTLRTHQRNHRTTLASQPKVSWPQGLPSNPLLPLSLVNRTFQTYAQEILFKNVSLLSIRQASLFLPALTRPHPSVDQRNTHEDGDAEEVRSSAIDPYPYLSRLARHVRTLQLRCISPYSMHNALQGGGPVLRDIIWSCPYLENITINTMLPIECTEALLDALASQRLIKEFVIISNGRRGSTLLRWNIHDLLGRVFPQWDFLETIELDELEGRSEIAKKQIHTVPKPKLTCALRTMILRGPEVDEDELSMLVNSFRGSMRTLEITGPVYTIGRAGICRILKECTNPELECLKLDWPHNEYPILSPRDGIESDDPVTSPGLLDIVFKSPSALRKLKSLTFTGNLATPKLFERLPDSIVKLAWQNCDLCPTALVEVLSSRRKEKKLLPNLKCCSVRSRDGWDMDEELVRSALKARGICFHMDLDSDYGDPMSEDERREAAEEMDPHLLNQFDENEYEDLDFDYY
ncbi:hypothetical protein PTTG_01895 [Puccinia triticina 1-1 BBBD Race 1]|uniref:Uncharacterized protein n=2 Tax=Puccinia triticina TaxID=208348 RepID=A0A180G7N6_PUCT1|nr:uncharacterized protein PtA15_1A627 [Puccinia triticina]OAV88715.1 hypothetical protein PTTG_01895 [Puccinia triticina 1-1 BBBD Race 1]WAQ81287.1 hypothetical protein PtA15_1A627 [Puccinia triticina]WAR52177.1 hypothetical protein PtB15_1B616 [Puccinia triticina]